MKKAKTFLDYLLNLSKEYKKITIILFLLAIGLTVYFGIIKHDESSVETYVVERENLEEATALTGKVVAAEEANVTFEKSGVVKQVAVDIGQRVKKGQALAYLSSADENARVAEAAANVQAQRAILADLSTGGRQAQIDIKKAQVDKAQTDVVQAYKNAGDSIRNISISGNTYVRDSFSSQFTGSKIEGYRLNIATCDSGTETTVNNLRGQAEEALTQIENISNSYDANAPLDPNGDRSIQDKNISDVKSIYLPKLQEFLFQMKNLYSASCMTSSGNNYDSTRTIITTGRNSLSTLSNDLSSKKNLIDSYKIALIQARKDLDLASSGEKDQKIEQQKAQVNASIARLAEAQAEAEKNVLRAPFNGVVTNIDIKVGELASVGGKSVSLISDSNFEIESKVSEVDVAKLKLGSKAEFTFDAYGDDQKFEAVITSISPAGIITDGVPTYKTVFSVVSKDDRIRSGMTANLEVVTATYNNVLYVPAIYVTNDKGVKKVTIKKENKLEPREVKLGARGLNGELEVLEGLSGGETLIAEKKSN